MAKVIDGRDAVAKAIKGQIYDELREALTKPNGKKKASWTQHFIQQLLKEAGENPNSPVGQLVARQLMTEDIISKLDAETDKYLARDIDFNEFRLLKTLYDKQRNVFLDNEPKKIIIGSRRIGKTELAARLLIKECLKPNRHALFISLKFENAIRQCYTLVDNLIDALGIPTDHRSKADGEIAFSNGSYILFKGNANNAEASKLLGYKYSLVVIDEVQNQCNLKFLLDDVLRPTMVDYEDSHLVLIGTPPRTPKTVAEDIWKNWKGWKKYSWSLLENPFLKNAEKFIDDTCIEKGITRDSPFIKREFYGQFFYDTEAQIYKGYKVYEGEIPNNFIPTHIAIGCDWGGVDYNAIVPLAYNIDTKEAYVFNTKKFNHATSSYIIDECRKTYEDCKEFMVKRNRNADLGNIMFLCDTNEKSLVWDLGQTYNLPAFCCYKYDKPQAISRLADFLRSGRIKVEKDGILQDEFEQAVYKRDEQDNLTSDIDDELFHPDAADALLYAARQMWFDYGEELGGESSDRITNK